MHIAAEYDPFRCGHGPRHAPSNCWVDAEGFFDHRVAVREVGCGVGELDWCGTTEDSVARCCEDLGAEFDVGGRVLEQVVEDAA